VDIRYSHVSKEDYEKLKALDRLLKKIPLEERPYIQVYYRTKPKKTLVIRSITKIKKEPTPRQVFMRWLFTKLAIASRGKSYDGKTSAPIMNYMLKKYAKNIDTSKILGLERRKLKKWEQELLESIFKTQLPDEYIVSSERSDYEQLTDIYEEAKKRVSERKKFYRMLLYKRLLEGAI